MNMKRRYGVLWCLPLLIPMACGSARADSVAVGSTVATLSRLHAQAAVLKERLAVARLQAEIRKEDTGGAAMGSPPVAVAGQGQMLQGFLSGQTTTPPPPPVAVQSIIGMAPRLQAVVALASGATLTVHVGDK
ncbi:MAG: type IV pilus biogenesis protein PilP, partial [Thermoplasmataceae archaeon]